MALDDLLIKLEREAGTSGTAGAPAGVPKKPLQTQGGTAGTAGTAEKDNGKGNVKKAMGSGHWLQHYDDGGLLPDRPVKSGAECEPFARCRVCRYLRKPGLSSGYCGGGRDDLPGAYGLHHPLRKLPDDLGASCVRHEPIE